MFAESSGDRMIHQSWINRGKSGLEKKQSNKMWFKNTFYSLELHNISNSGFSQHC